MAAKNIIQSYFSYLQYMLLTITKKYLNPIFYVWLFYLIFNNIIQHYHHPVTTYCIVYSKLLLYTKGEAWITVHCTTLSTYLIILFNIIFFFFFSFCVFWSFWFVSIILSLPLLDSGNIYEYIYIIVCIAIFSHAISFPAQSFTVFFFFCRMLLAVATVFYWICSSSFLFLLNLLDFLCFICCFDSFSNSGPYCFSNCFIFYSFPVLFSICSLSCFYCFLSNFYSFI